MKSQDLILPPGWGIAPLGIIAAKITKGSTPTTYGYTFQSQGINFLKVENVKKGRINLDSIVDYISEEANDNQEKSKLAKNDILFSIAGTIGEIAIVKDIHLPANTNQAFAIISGYGEVLYPTFLEHQLRSFVSSKAKGKARGGAMNNVSLADLKELLVFVPPLNEQHRIVAKLEELFSELDKGIESLKTARQQLKVYRQAMLKHAFEGKLTEQWRAEHADELETADDVQGGTSAAVAGRAGAAKLLQRIQQQRQARYQQQLDAWQAEVKRWETEGKEGRKASKPSKIQLMSLVQDEEVKSLPEIPSGWVWVKYGDLCSVVRNGISKKPVGDVGEKIFRISAVRSMFFDVNDYRIIENNDGEFDAYFLQKGDLVFTRYNGSRRYVGVCAEYKFDEGTLFPDKLVQTRADLPCLNTSYLEKALNCGGSRKFVESMIRTTAGQSGVSGGDIKNIPVPVCSLSEQVEISTQLNAVLSVLDDQGSEMEANLQRSEALRQSILKKAFSGRLVAQDPNDEPASELLQRNQAHKAELAAQAKAAKAATKKSVIKKRAGRKKAVSKERAAS